MTKYREIIRLNSLGLSQRQITESCHVSKKTVTKVLKKASELSLEWPLSEELTDAVLAQRMFPKQETSKSTRKMPNYEYVRKELRKNGVSKKLLWTEYLEDCRSTGEEPLMYSQFCYYIQQDEEKRRATMHVPRAPGEQVEVDWAGDKAYIIDPSTGKERAVSIFVGVMSYSQYAYAEACYDEKTPSWINSHIHMFEYFGGVPKILIPDNCKTAVVHNNSREQVLNETYREMSEHYNIAIIPARVRKPKDKPNAEAGVNHVSQWIIAALRNEQFLSIEELNREIWKRLDEFNRKPFTKKEGSRHELFLDEELPLLAKLPSTKYELATWKKATVQYNYHITVEGMLYSVPHNFIKEKVDVKLTDTTVQIFHKQERIATHTRLYGRKGQYSTEYAHMPKDHQQYMEWDGKRLRNWANKVGPNTYKVIDAMLSQPAVEQQAYRGCIALLKLQDKYSKTKLEIACEKALEYTNSPSLKNVKNILVTLKEPDPPEPQEKNPYALTRGAAYYSGRNEK